MSTQDPPLPREVELLQTRSHYLTGLHEGMKSLQMYLLVISITFSKPPPLNRLVKEWMQKGTAVVRSKIVKFKISFISEWL